MPIGVAGLFSDIDGPLLTYSATGLPAGLTLNPATGVISGQIAANGSQGGSGGAHSVVITARDGQGGSATTTLIWTVTNIAPIANDDARSVLEDTLLSSTVASNDMDGGTDTDLLTYTLQTGPANGTLILNSNGSFTYQPNSNYNGPDGFTYQVSDGQGGTSTAIVTLNVTPVNDAPTPGTIASRTSNDGNTVTLNVSTAFTDVEGDTLTFSATGLPPGLVIDPVTGIISGTIDGSASRSGPYTVIVTASDGNGGTTPIGFSWIVNNPPPIATGEAVTLSEDSSISGTLRGGDHDPDGDALTYSLSSAPSSGHAIVNPDGTFRYVPNSNFTGTDTFTYLVTDADGGTTTATVTVTVTPVQDPPIARDDTVRTIGSNPVVIPVLLNDTDPDGDPLRIVSATSLNGIATINSNGTVTFAAAPTFIGTATVTYVVEDTAGNRSTATISIAVDDQVFVTLETRDPIVTPEKNPEEPLIVAQGAVLDAVRGAGGLNGIANGIGDTGAVLAAANQAQALDGLSGHISGNGFVLAEVDRIEQIRQLDTLVDQYARIDGRDITAKNLTGFTLRMALADSLIGSSQGSQVVLETLVRDRELIVQISSKITDGDQRPIEYRITQANGRPLPAWIDRVGQNLLIAQRPVDVDKVTLRVVAVMPDGRPVVREVEIQGSTGEIQPLQKDRRSDLLAPKPFLQNFAQAPTYDAADIEDLARTLDDLKRAIETNKIARAATLEAGADATSVPSIDETMRSARGK